MQTFLPYPSYSKSAKFLDWQRLGKQRSESMIMLKTLLGMYKKGKGWINHPATKMWKGYEYHLCLYSIFICKEWRKRGYKNNGTLEWFLDLRKKLPKGPKPPWIGLKKLHASHRSNLLRKDKKFYRKYKWSEPNDLEYYWPVKK